MILPQRTFIMVKPDGVQRSMIGNIISRFEARGMKLVRLKFVQATQEMFEEHYYQFKDETYFPSMVEYLTSSPVVAMVWEGLDAVNIGRSMLGNTDPLASLAGTIRGDLALSFKLTVCHASDSVENAGREIQLWFPDNLAEQL